MEIQHGPKDGVGKIYKAWRVYKPSISYPALIREINLYIHMTQIGISKYKTKTEELKTRFKYLDIRFQGTKFNDKEGTLYTQNKINSLNR